LDGSVTGSGVYDGQLDIRFHANMLMPLSNGWTWTFSKAIGINLGLEESRPGSQ